MLHRLLHCGDGAWQREYAQLHDGILAGREEPRYLLAHGQNGVQQVDLHLRYTTIRLSQASWPNDMDIRPALGQGSPDVSMHAIYCWHGGSEVKRRKLQQQMPQARHAKSRVHGGAAGLADSLVGAVTLFWVAVLQRRAFAMKFGAFGAYEWAFDQPHINWTW
jgi:hypothetical protein